ncbi:DeoR/GlpR family DNA-binding transcription regulator [Brochothrix campestris]|uniref:DeoR-like helix-turn-helix domain-containing protein n=1 Tax=Brochothrix campestris FSL F6-1037 TaxID=1265861 RepID=W7D9I1_9LIST|nr:DeoR/GlpR family DNA-binding transcription regulator [Brochothrix campestris]EUJ41908.1 deoR-like helix-turn-helix domain-containing protein [Brochothrix campestris FSL F6-1037]
MRAKRLVALNYYIQQRKSVSLDELCSHFKVSKNTIRRDINLIIANGTIEKVYGGVKSLVNSELVTFEHRHITNHDSKEAIATTAASLIEDGDFIFIDSGTTTVGLIEQLPPTIQLTILTNSLDIINVGATFQNIRLLLVGNTYKAETRSFVGLNMTRMISKYNITKAFMAASAVSIENGLTNSDLMEYDIKRTIVSRATTTYLLADYSKFNKATLLTYADFEEINVLITDKPLPPGYQHFCDAHQITVITSPITY